MCVKDRKKILFVGYPMNNEKGSGIRQFQLMVKTTSYVQFLLKITMTIFYVLLNRIYRYIQIKSPKKLIDPCARNK